MSSGHKETGYGRHEVVDARKIIVHGPKDGRGYNGVISEDLVESCSCGAYRVGGGPWRAEPTCTTCGLPMADPNHDGELGPPACPGPSAKPACATCEDVGLVEVSGPAGVPHVVRCPKCTTL